MIVYTLWAALKEDPSAFWMIAAEDEYSFEGDPDRCEREFRDAEERAAGEGWLVREINLVIDEGKVDSSFTAAVIDAKVDAP